MVKRGPKINILFLLPWSKILYEKIQLFRISATIAIGQNKPEQFQKYINGIFTVTPIYDNRHILFVIFVEWLCFENIANTHPDIFYGNIMSIVSYSVVNKA